MKDETIPDLSITASSAFLDPNGYKEQNGNVFVYDGFKGRLDWDSFWKPANNEGSWVQVDFGYLYVKLINGIITQGSIFWDQWVETLKVQYGNNTHFLTDILDGRSPKV